MTALSEPKSGQVDASIRKALEAALERGALPGESDDFDHDAATAAATFLARTADVRKSGQLAIAIETLGEGATGR